MIFIFHCHYLTPCYFNSDSNNHYYFIHTYTQSLINYISTWETTESKAHRISIEYINTIVLSDTVLRISICFSSTWRDIGLVVRLPIIICDLFLFISISSLCNCEPLHSENNGFVPISEWKNFQYTLAYSIICKSYKINVSAKSELAIVRCPLFWMIKDILYMMLMLSCLQFLADPANQLYCFVV